MVKTVDYTINSDIFKKYDNYVCFMDQSLTQTMCLISALLTEEHEGGSDMIPFESFKELYVYLAQMNCGPSKGEEDASDGTVPLVLEQYYF